MIATIIEELIAGIKLAKNQKIEITQVTLKLEDGTLIHVTF